MGTMMQTVCSKCADHVPCFAIWWRSQSLRCPGAPSAPRTHSSAAAAGVLDSWPRTLSLHPRQPITVINSYTHCVPLKLTPENLIVWLVEYGETTLLILDLNYTTIFKCSLTIALEEVPCCYLYKNKWIACTVDIWGLNLPKILGGSTYSFSRLLTH